MKNIILYLFILFLIPTFVGASQLYLKYDSKEGDFFRISLYIDASEKINSVSGKIKFDDKLISLERIDEGISVLDFWVEKPEYKENNLNFSGITTNGFDGKNRPILSLLFSVKNKGVSIFKIEDVLVLANDGLGSKIDVSVNNDFKVDTESILKSESYNVPDKIKPEIFYPILGQFPDIFENKFFITFSAIDKQSGIKYYKIKESRHRFFNFLNIFKTTESPMLLNDQSLRSFVFIKAIDYAGNERLMILHPRYPLKWYENIVYWITILVLVLLIFTKKIWFYAIKRYFFYR